MRRMEVYFIGLEGIKTSFAGTRALMVTCEACHLLWTMISQDISKSRSQNGLSDAGVRPRCNANKAL